MAGPVNNRIDLTEGGRVAPADPWHVARQRHSWEEVNPGQWLCKDCGAEEDGEGNQTVPPMTSYCSPAPAGDGGLREALERKLATTDGWAVANETLLDMLRAHPAALVEAVPTKSHEVCCQYVNRTYPHDSLGKCLGDTDGDGNCAWHPAGCPSIDVFAAPAVPQPAEELDVEKFPCACPDSFQDNGIEATYCPRHNWPEMEPWLREAGYTLIPAAVPQPVDREALARLAEKWSEHSEPAPRYSYPEANAEAGGIEIGYMRAAEELAAVLAGEQEQVER